MSELLRLDFQRGPLIPDIDYLKTGICTYGMQGKIFYKCGNLIYTQSRDDLPDRMKIREKELEKEEYMPLFDLIVTRNIADRLGHLDWDELTAVLMVSRQDLLITHKYVSGTQVFLLGYLTKEGFIPACKTFDGDGPMTRYYKTSNIELSSTYGEGGRMYIPDQISSIDDVIKTDGAFVHTVDGVPKTIYSEKMDEIFNLFSDTQNNRQLFVKVFFVDGKPSLVEDLHKTLEKITPFTPQDKVTEFIVLIEKFKELLQFFMGKAVCFSLANGKGSIKLAYEEEQEKWMEKPEKALKTLLSNMNRMLVDNKLSGGAEGISLHHQVSGALFSFFNYERNVNNCCHLIKHLDKITFVR